MRSVANLFPTIDTSFHLNSQQMIPLTQIHHNCVHKSVSPLVNFRGPGDNQIILLLY